MERLAVEAGRCCLFKAVCAPGAKNVEYLLACSHVVCRFEVLASVSQIDLRFAIKSNVESISF